MIFARARASGTEKKKISESFDECPVNPAAELKNTAFPLASKEANVRGGWMEFVSVSVDLLK